MPLQLRFFAIALQSKVHNAVQYFCIGPQHVRIANLSRHSFFEELPVCVSLFPFLSFSPTPPQPTCEDTLQASLNKNDVTCTELAFSLQVLSALVTPLGGMTTLIGMG